MEENRIVRREHSFLHSPLKPQIFVSQNWEEWVGIDLGLMKFLLKLLKNPLISAVKKKKKLSFLHPTAHVVIAHSLQSEAAAIHQIFGETPIVCQSFFFFVCHSLQFSVTAHKSFFLFFFFVC